MEKAIEDMTEEAFQKHIQALAIRRLDKPKKLSAECAKYWGEIISQQYNYDRGNIKELHCGVGACIESITAALGSVHFVSVSVFIWQQGRTGGGGALL